MARDRHDLRRLSWFALVSATVVVGAACGGVQNERVFPQTTVQPMESVHEFRSADDGTTMVLFRADAPGGGVCVLLVEAESRGAVAGTQPICTLEPVIESSDSQDQPLYPIGTANRMTWGTVARDVDRVDAVLKGRQAPVRGWAGGGAFVVDGLPPDRRIVGYRLFRAGKVLLTCNLAQPDRAVSEPDC